MGRYRRYGKYLGVGNRCSFFKRDIHKSVRLDERVYRYIMECKGNDFPDKLENLVIDHAQLTGRSE